MKYQEAYNEWKDVMSKEFDKTEKVFASDLYRISLTDLDKLHKDTYNIKLKEIGEIKHDFSNIKEVYDIVSSNTVGKINSNERFIEYTIEEDINAWSGYQTDEVEIEEVILNYFRKYAQLVDRELYFNVNALHIKSLKKFITDLVKKSTPEIVYINTISCGLLKLYKEDKITLKEIKGTFTC